jgi:citrate lyase subunit beta/citryl-CoA lyase
MIESAAGFKMLEQLAAVPAVERFALGTWDLLVDLSLLAVSDPDESELIWQLRGQLVLASRQLRLRPPIDGVCASLEDDERFFNLCKRVHQLGYGGKMLVHPRQVAIASTVFGPEEGRLQFAREVVAEYERAATLGVGVVRVRGLMIDRPMVEQARALLNHWSTTVSF